MKTSELRQIPKNVVDDWEDRCLVTIGNDGMGHSCSVPGCSEGAVNCMVGQWYEANRGNRSSSSQK